MKRGLFVASSLAALGASGCGPIKDNLTNGPFRNVLASAQWYNRMAIDTRGLARLYPDSAIDRNFRVNGLDTRWGFDDVVGVVEAAGDRLDVILVPKPQAPRDIWYFDTLLAQLELKLDLKKKIGLEAIIEESAALACVEQIAGAARGSSR